MPFTFAHPALVLPLKKWENKLSLTGLIIGSLSPDFEFLFQMHVAKNIGHHGFGVFIFDLPVSIFLSFLFHYLLKKPLIENLSIGLNSRFEELYHSNWLLYFKENWNWVIYSIFLGIYSHLFLDAFTHEDGVFVLVFPLLSLHIGIGEIKMPIYLFLQIFSSVLGLYLLYGSTLKLESRNGIKKDRMEKIIYWTLWLAISLYILLVRLLLWPQYHSFWDNFIALIGSGIYGILATCLIWNFQIIIKWQEE